MVSGRMVFDGMVGDLGSKVENVTTYEMALIGVDEVLMREHLIREAEKKGLKVIGITVDKLDGGKVRVGMRVESLRGIV